MRLFPSAVFVKDALLIEIYFPLDNVFVEPHLLFGNVGNHLIRSLILGCFFDLLAETKTWTNVSCLQNWKYRDGLLTNSRRF